MHAHSQSCCGRLTGRIGSCTLNVRSVEPSTWCIYLARYTHRVAISSHRLLSLEDHRVTFRWRDSRHHNKQRQMTLDVYEFLRRFFLHVLPLGFVRIRYVGLFAHRRRNEVLPLCRRLLAESSPQSSMAAPTASERPLWTCPICGGPMTVIERLT